MTLYLGGVTVVIRIKRLSALILTIGIILLSFLLNGCLSFDDNDYVLSCYSTELKIPTSYVVHQSKFLWIEFDDGLDTTECSVRTKFNTDEGLRL